MEVYPIISVGGIKFFVFPFFFIAAVYVCLFILLKSKKFNALYFPDIISIMIYALLGALVGGKLLYLATKIFSDYVTILELINGFVFYGGLIGSIIGVCISCTIKKISITDILDVYLSLMPLGQAIGRIGCYFNGCCYGKRYSGIGAIDYIINGNCVKVFPTWFVEAAYCLGVFFILFYINKKIYSGVYASVYLIVYSVFRFWIEDYRGDIIRGSWAGKSTSQYISIIVFIGGVVLGIICFMNKKENMMIKGKNKYENNKVMYL
ncbi:MAG TPA: hypothetical protein DCE60_03830 [Coprococcus sp.]|nr:hypothetical protein [Coprococcus sp.]